MQRRLLVLVLVTAFTLTVGFGSVASAQAPGGTQAARTPVAGHGVVNRPAVVESRIQSVDFSGSPAKPLGILVATLLVAGYAMRAMARGFDSLVDG
jgi:hypothetical protein